METFLKCQQLCSCILNINLNIQICAILGVPQACALYISHSYQKSQAEIAELALSELVTHLRHLSHSNCRMIYLIVFSLF